MPTSSVKMCISICASPGSSRLCKSTPRTQSARVIPFDHARFSSAAYSLSMKRADRMRFRASGRLEPSVVGLNAIGFSIVEPPVSAASTNVNAVYGQFAQVHRCEQVDVCRQAFTFVYPPRGGVSKFFRCEAPFLLRHEIECRITPSLPAQKPWTPPPLQASSQAAPPHPSHPYLGLYGRATSRRPAWPVASSESPESRGPSRRHS